MTSSVGSVTSPGVLPSSASRSRRPATRPFSTSGWRTVVSPRGAAGGASSKPTTERSRGTSMPKGRAPVDDAERDLVGHAEHGGRLALEQRGHRLTGERPCVHVDLVDRHLVPAQAGVRERLLVAGEPLGGDAVGEIAAPVSGDEAAPAVVAQAQRDDRQAAVAEVEEVLRGRARSAAVVDPDERDAGDVRRVGDDEREVPLERGGDARVIRRAARRRSRRRRARA